MSSLYTLLREYEERRQSLVDQLQKNPNLDPAVQHQIYGAIKEIETFVKSIEFHISNTHEKNIALELARDRPQPIREKTRKVVNKMKAGTEKVLKEHIPAASKKIASVPKRYFAKRREKVRMRLAIEREIKQRMQAMTHQPLPEVEPIVPHQDPAVVAELSEEKPVQKAPAKKKKKKAKKKKKRK
ncbi:MAG: hypothetical protein OXR66_07880 [Candidatus Woesearchaeota archaeon]|nr:hypothetical protein [Candidatus Woesearchaeota archaeon]